MNRADFHDLSKVSETRYRLVSKHNTTYLTTRMVLYTDPQEFGLHAADVMEAIERRHQSDVRAVCTRLGEYVDDRAVCGKPRELLNQISLRPLIDWAECIPNPEEFMALVADLRLLEELVNNRVNYEVDLDTAHRME